MIENRLKTLEENMVVHRLMYENQEITYYCNFNTLNQDRESIILLHPAFADYRIFINQFEAWQDRYNLIAIDLIGHGKNNDLKEMALDAMPAIIKEIIHVHKIDQVHLLGVSLGSLIAQALADQITCKSLTIVGGYSIHKNNEKILKKQAKEMWKWLFLMVFAMNRFRSYVTQVSTKSQEGQYVFKLGSKHFMRRSIIVMRGMNNLFKKSSEDLKYPLLIVVGEYDLTITIDHNKELSQIESMSRYQLVKGAGHCVNIDQAQTFNKLYEDFISSI